MTEEKPDYFTAWENFCDVFPELSKRCNLGAGKYEKFDWRKRDFEYFWKKLFRHMSEAADDIDSVDEDGLPHITAMLFHVAALTWKKLEREQVMQSLADEAQERGEYETEENMPSESKDDQQPMSLKQWATERGYAAPIGDRYEGMLLPKYEGGIDGVRALYQEYLSDFQRNRPNAQADES